MKTKIYEHCLQIVMGKLQIAENTVLNLREEIENETKCSCGDKHETSRAMIHIEQEKSGKQFSDALNLKKALDEIDLSKNTKTIGLGSFVGTNKGNFFISVSLGKITIENEVVYAISLNSPIGKALENKKAGDVIIYNSNKYIIDFVE